ncbi:MAG: 16S rRNA (cytidine(1402)-2'-O)-methyltransferase [Pseudomonadota bacterium]
MSMQTGALYVVATPIGNMGDITRRGVEVLQQVDLIAAEDTRHTAGLLSRLGIDARTISFHQHNERQRSQQLVELLLAGEDVALVSDAGTPLICDPGYPIVTACRERGIAVIPVPGASAVIAALSVSGLPTDRFLFEGFLPRTRSKRLKRLRELADFSSTLVFYESSHRILHTLEDMLTQYGEDRRVVVARELTKQFETIIDLPLGRLLQAMTADANQRRGEFVVMVAGSESRVKDNASLMPLLQALVEEMPPNQAARVAARISGRPKRELYQLLTRMKTRTDSE